MIFCASWSVLFLCPSSALGFHVIIQLQTPCEQMLIGRTYVSHIPRWEHSQRRRLFLISISLTVQCRRWCETVFALLCILQHTPVSIHKIRLHSTISQLNHLSLGMLPHFIIIQLPFCFACFFYLLYLPESSHVLSQCFVTCQLVPICKLFCMAELGSVKSSCKDIGKVRWGEVRRGRTLAHSCAPPQRVTIPGVWLQRPVGYFFWLPTKKLSEG